LCYYIDEIWVAEEYRNQGVASALLNAVEKEARNAGVWQVRLYVSEDNPSARRCYAKNGYQEDGGAIFCTKKVL
jgi:ribosomal protein S18 acetylase RimI-like enzyme